MIADSGTRKGLKTEQVDQESVLKKRFWMGETWIFPVSNKAKQKDSVTKRWNNHSEKRIYSLW